MINMFIAAILIVTAIVLYFSASLLKGSKALFILAPVALAACLTLVWTVKEIQSRPIEGYPEDEFVTVHFVTDGVEVYLWAVEEDKGDFPKTFVFPYEDEVVKKLQEIKEKADQGAQVRGKMKKKKDGFEVTILGSPRSTERANTLQKDY